jgi:Lrp/AsnC family leucine-responsive transcriptional regulator
MTILAGSKEKYSGMRNLDATDWRILRLLQENAKYTNKEIAARLGMTTTPVYERIKRLEEDGYVSRYVALLNREQLGLHMLAFCNVSLKEHSQPFLKQFESEVRSLQEVVACYHLAGIYDYLLKVIIKDMAAYQDFIVNKLASLDNIGKVQSSFVMTPIKESTQLPI